MCNAYEIGRPVKRLPKGSLLEITAPLAAGSKDRLIRRTDPAPVITAALDLVTMRWGFERPQLGTINNSREDKLSGPMWSKAFRERRCVIPASAFYEWSGPKGHKQTHRFTRSDQGWIWIAGIWEESREFGPCFSMITTNANSMMAPIHDRMPAVLEEEQVPAYFAGEIEKFAPAVESLQVEDAANPLVKRKEPPLQGELF
jgi:putative SOS response-associated peptidase YedK